MYYYIDCSTSWPDAADFPEDSSCLQVLFTKQIKHQVTSHSLLSLLHADFGQRQTCAVKGHVVSCFDIDGHSLGVFCHNVSWSRDFIKLPFISFFGLHIWQL